MLITRSASAITRSASTIKRFVNHSISFSSSAEAEVEALVNVDPDAGDEEVTQTSGGLDVDKNGLSLPPPYYKN